MLKLDLKDKKLLYSLEYDARVSELELAKKTGLSREVVRYRLNKLEHAGIIRQYNTIVDTLRLGFLMFRTYYRLTGIPKEKEQELINFLKQHVNWVTKVEGRWNLTTMNFAKNIYDYENFIKLLKQNFGEYIQDYWVSTMTKLHHYKRSYLIDKKQDDFDLLMGLKKKETIKDLDSLDIKIINTIITDARMNSVDIAKNVGASAKLVRERIKRMQKEKIILGFTTFLDINKLDKHYFKVHFKLMNHSPETYRSLQQYALQHPNIAYSVEAIGGDDLELELQVDDNHKLYQIIDDIKRTFPDMIYEYYFMEYTEEFKYDYLPKDIAL